MPLLQTARALAARAGARLRNLAPPSQKAWRAAPYVTVSGPRWPIHQPRDYAAFARKGFMQNAIAYRSVRMIAEAVGHIPYLLYDSETGGEVEVHALKDLLRRPAPNATITDFLEQLVGFLLVSGNAYIEAVATGSANVRALYALRPDRMTLVPGPDGWPDAYAYTLDGRTTEISGDAVPGVPRLRHIKLFHPLDDHYGLSPLEAAAQAIDLHNTASSWNKALLDNSARPSGALVYTARDGNLTSDQFERLKRELETGFQGARNAGRPLLLEGGLDWKAMSLSPKDLDFIEARNAAAREIALALGVPPMLLAIPGDNTYSNYQEATRAFWRGTVLPLATRIADGLSSWLAAPHGLVIRIDTDAVDALAPERDALWARLDAATFLTPNEKRSAAGYDALPDGGDGLSAKAGFNPGQARLPAGSPGGGRWGGGAQAEYVSRRRHVTDGTPAQLSRLESARAQASIAVSRLRRLEPSWRQPPGVYGRDIEGRIAHLETLRRDADTRYAAITRDAVPGTNPAWGLDRLRSELHDRGFYYERPARGDGWIYTNPTTGEYVRIMERPQRVFRNDPSAKHTFSYYYRYQSSRNDPEGNHIPIPDGDMP